MRRFTKKENAALTNLLNAGELCSNVCFNLKQASVGTPIDAMHIGSMGEAQKIWDRARQEFRECFYGKSKAKKGKPK